jgi:hypothetical protein
MAKRNEALLLSFTNTTGYPESALLLLLAQGLPLSSRPISSRLSPGAGREDHVSAPSTPHTPMDLVSRYTKNCRPIYQTITTQYSRLGLQNPSSPSSNFRSTIRSSPIDLSCSVNVLYEEVPPRMVVMPLRDQGVSRPRVGGL